MFLPGTTLPGNPRNLIELDEILLRHRPMNGFYKGMARATDESVGLVFIHDDMIEALSQCTQLFEDGTFEVRIYAIKLSYYYYYFY